MDGKTIELRAHTERFKQEKSRGDNNFLAIIPDKWPKRALVFDCETTIDQSQSLTFGCYRYCRLGKDGYEAVQEGLFYADEVGPEQVAILKAYGKAHCIKVLSRSEFTKRIFWQAVRAEALIVGFNLPFDLSRLALESPWSTRRGGAWSLMMNQYRDRKTGEICEDKCFPRITIKPKDGKGAFFNLMRVPPVSKKRPRACKQYPPIRCLDLKTLFWALYSKSHTLASACKTLGIPGKLEGHKPTGKITIDEIKYNVQDGIATVGLLNALKLEFDRHPIELNPDRAFSPASTAKSYLDQMGLALPSQQFKLPADINGIAMQGYYGGRVETRIRNTDVPVVYLDFMSQYPTVNTLMGLWRFLTAEQLVIEDATNETGQFLERITLEQTFDLKLWAQLPFFALAEPSEDILPVRARYNEKNCNIAVNPLTKNTPVWFAGPDIVASVVLTGKVPKILKAIRVVPKEQQTGLNSTRLRSVVNVDPTSEDFFRKVIEARSQIKSDTNLPENDRHALAYFLKILANSGSYGFLWN